MARDSSRDRESRERREDSKNNRESGSSWWEKTFRTRNDEEERKKFIEKVEREENVKFKSYNPNTGEMIFIRVERSGGDRTRVLIPSEENLSYYDAMLYAYKNIPTNEVKETFKANLDYLSKVDKNLASSYKRVRTIRDYLNATGKFEEFFEQLKSTIDFVTYDLNLNGYSKETFEQCVKRANALIDNIPII